VLLIAPVFILLAVTGVAIISVRKFPYLIVGWFWYLGTLVPVIGLVQVGSQAMADRYTYLPLIGVFIMIAWSLHDFLRVRPYFRIIFSLVSGVILMLLVVMTQIQVGYWKNSITLFSQAIRNTEGNYQAHYTLALAMAEKSDFAGASDHYQEALKIKPSFAEANGGLGHILMTQGKYDEANSRLEAALRVKPKYVPALKHLGDLRMRQQRVDDALPLYQQALLYNKDDHELFNNYGVALFCKGQEEDALLNIREAIRLKPDYIDACNNLRKILEHRVGR
jgi:Tfp pilus assembly protein PilF